MIKHSIKLYSNTEDNMHCVQACLQMVFSYFDLSIPSIGEFDGLTNHLESKYTQDTDVMLFLLSRGFKVRHIEPLDYGRFANSGRSYLQELFSKERYEDQERNGDIDADQIRAKELIKSDAELLVRRPVLADVISALNEEFIPIVSMGSHVVVVTGYDKENVFINDPGNPAPAVSYMAAQADFESTLYSVMCVGR